MLMGDISCNGHVETSGCEDSVIKGDVGNIVGGEDGVRYGSGGVCSVNDYDWNIHDNDVLQSIKVVVLMAV